MVDCRVENIVRGNMLQKLRQQVIRVWTSSSEFSRVRKGCMLQIITRQRHQDFEIFKIWMLKTQVTPTHAVYVLECPCQQQYVGRTTRGLKIRIGEHINNIKKGFEKHSVSRHFKVKLKKDPSLLTFYGIENIKGTLERNGQSQRGIQERNPLGI